MSNYKIFFCRMGAIFLLLSLFLGLLFASFPLRVSAAESAFMSTTVEEDLKAAGLDPSLYLKNPATLPQVLLFTELGYTEENYGLDDGFHLLVYVYNPSGVPLDLSKENTVNFSIGDDNFSSCKLMYFGSSDDDLLYRFYLERESEYLQAARSYAKEHDGARAYSVAGLQLYDTSAGALKDTEVAKIFTFRGYAKGCHSATELIGTLSCSFSGLETISLTLNHTTWRNRVYDPANGGFQDEGVCDAISTVYFGVPEDYIYSYRGGLQQISAEWHEYRTTPIFVTWDYNSDSDDDAYDELYPWIGKTLGMGNDTSFSDHRNSLTRRVLWNTEVMTASLPGGGTSNYYKFGNSYNPNAYNANDGSSVFLKQHTNVYGTDLALNHTPRMDYLFGIEAPKEFDDARISSEMLSDYMRWYTANIASKNDALVLDRLSANLFEASIDADRVKLLANTAAKRGLVRQTVTANEVGTTLVEKDISFWQEFWGGKQTEAASFKVLHVFDFSDIAYVSGLDANNADDVAAFEARYFVENWNTGAKSGNVLKEIQDLINADQVPVLYRFAVTDYTVYNARFDNTDDWYSPQEDKNGVRNVYNGSANRIDAVDGYVAQETVFLDFDVISLGFDTGEAGKSLKIIPVVADPIDVISGLIAPNDVPVEEEPWWQKIMMLLLLVLFFVIVWPILSPVLMVLFRILGVGLKLLAKPFLWLLSLPFKLLGIIFRRR